MDDEELYGPELHRLGFGEAVERGPADRLQGDRPRGRRGNTSARPSSSQLADKNTELNLDDAVKIIGCWNGLDKRRQRSATPIALEGGTDAPSRRLLRSIKDSKQIIERFAGWSTTRANRARRPRAR